MVKVIAAAVMVAATVAAAETHLKGPIQQAAFGASGNPYIVDQDVTVPAGSELTIGEGCVLLFKPFTGLQVEGRLLIKGTADRPVVLTSYNDGDHNPSADKLPNPFDWNGLLIGAKSGGAHLKGFQLRYSVYGIKAQTQDVRIENGVFRQNGQFHFTIDDKIQYVQDNIPYSYGVQQPSAEAPAEAPLAQPKKPRERRSSVSKGRSVVRYTCLGLGVAGLTFGTVFAVAASGHKADRDAAEAYVDSTNADYYEGLWKEAENSRKQSLAGSVLSYAFGAGFLVGFSLTFVF